MYSIIEEMFTDFEVKFRQSRHQVDFLKFFLVKKALQLFIIYSSSTIENSALSVIDEDKSDAWINNGGDIKTNK